MCFRFSSRLPLLTPDSPFLCKKRERERERNGKRRSLWGIPHPLPPLHGVSKGVILRKNGKYVVQVLQKYTVQSWKKKCMKKEGKLYL
jgi:hypothetical protein